MRRATTPLHRFTFPIDPATFEKILITYSQGKTIVLEKTKDDLTIDGMIARFRMTQEEANAFRVNDAVKIQVRVLTYAGDALASNIIQIGVKEVLNDAVL